MNVISVTSCHSSVITAMKYSAEHTGVSKITGAVWVSALTSFTSLFVQFVRLVSRWEVTETLMSSGASIVQAVSVTVKPESKRSETGLKLARSELARYPVVTSAWHTSHGSSVHAVWSRLARLIAHLKLTTVNQQSQRTLDLPNQNCYNIIASQEYSLSLQVQHTPM